MTVSVRRGRRSLAVPRARLGFLGAGVILRGGQRIFHVATAASIWVTAALGIACGLGAWRLTALAVLAVVLILVIGSKIDHALYGRLGKEDDK